MIRKLSIIARLKKHIKKSKMLLKEDTSNELVFDALAMTCFQAVNAAIDLGEYIVSIQRNIRINV